MISPSTPTFATIGTHEYEGNPNDGYPNWESPDPWFQEFAAQHGFPAAVRWRDSGKPIPDGGGPVPAAADLAGEQS